MIHVLTDEQAVAVADKQIERVADAIGMLLRQYPGIDLHAIDMLLWRVNGQNWICHTDWARTGGKTWRVEIVR